MTEKEWLSFRKEECFVTGCQQKKKEKKISANYCSVGRH